jgi:hypothetical protein
MSVIFSKTKLVLSTQPEIFAKVFVIFVYFRIFPYNISTKDENTVYFIETSKTKIFVPALLVPIYFVLVVPDGELAK